MDEKVANEISAPGESNISLFPDMLVSMCKYLFLSLSFMKQIGIKEPQNTPTVKYFSCE